MSNSSIYAAFERMWLHIVTKLNNYATTEQFDMHIYNTSNPHEINKTQIGLGNVENKSAATILSEMTKSNIVDALGYAPSLVTVRSWSAEDVEV